VTAVQLLTVWLHLVAAVAWIGGMLFLSLVLAPLVRSRKAVPEFMALFRTAALRFRLVVYGAIVVLLVSGPILLHARGLSLWDPTPWPSVLRVKLGMIVLLLILTVVHDLILGPRMRAIGAKPQEERSRREQTVVRLSPWLPRLSLMLALAILFAAALLARS
jgi:putative copper export protein